MHHDYRTQARRDPKTGGGFLRLLAKQNQMKVNAWYGEHSTVLGLLGDTAAVDIESIAAPGYCPERQAGAGAL